MDLDKQLEQSDDWKDEYDSLCKELKGYAQEFYESLLKKYQIPTEPIQLPLTFFPTCQNYDQLSEGKAVTGNCIVSKSSIDIEIYFVLVYKSNINTLKQSIRHEIIHFFLLKNNLKFYDNSAIFHAFCDIYDANAYAELNCKEKGLLEKYHIAYQNIDTLQKIYENNKEANPKLSEQIFRNFKNRLLLELGLENDEQREAMNYIYPIATPPSLH